MSADSASSNGASASGASTATPAQANKDSFDYSDPCEAEAGSLFARGVEDPRYQEQPKCLEVALELAGSIHDTLRDEKVHHADIQQLITTMSPDVRRRTHQLDVSNSPEGLSPPQRSISSMSSRQNSITSQSSSWLGGSNGNASMRMSRASRGLGIRSLPRGLDRAGMSAYVSKAVEGAYDAAAKGPLPASTPSWARRVVSSQEALKNSDDPAAAPAATEAKPQRVHHRRRSSISLTMRLRPPPGPSRAIEDVRDKAILGAPITDICVRAKGSEPSDPKYYMVAKTVGGRNALVNAGNWGKDTYIWIRKDPTWSEPALTGLTVIFPDRGEFIPPGYGVIRHVHGAPFDLNENTSGDRVFLCRKAGIGNPIVDVQMVLLKKQEEPPEGYSLLSQTPLLHSADVNRGSGGTPVYLAYKQILVNLEPLKYDELEPLQPPEGLELVTEAAIVTERIGNYANAPVPDGAEASGAPSKNVSGTLPGSSLAVFSSVSEGMQPQDSIPLDMGYEDEGQTYVPNPYADFHSGEELYTGVVDVFGSIEHVGKRRALNAILAGVYVRHGSVPLKALKAIRKLLTDTDFYDTGLGELPAVGWTMLDVSIDAVCDRIELMLEDHLESCVDILDIAVRRTDGQINGWILQRVYKALHAVSMFHASRVHGWVRRTALRPYREGCGSGKAYPQKAFGTLRTFLGCLTLQVEACGDVDGLDDLSATPAKERQERASGSPTGQVSNEMVVREIVTEFLDTILDHVELSRVLNTVMNIVLRTQHEGAHMSGMETHWSELHKVASRIFGQTAHINLFVMLCVLCKASVAPLRRTSTGEIVARDLAGKLLGLEVLRDLLKGAGEHFCKSNVFGYLVRRLLSMVVFQNAVNCMWDIRVLQAVLGIVSTLWQRFRRHMRLELAVIADSLMLQVLRSNPESCVVSPDHQINVLKEMVSWFENTPETLVEIFLNFDMDLSARSWSIFENLCAALSTLAEIKIPVGSAHDSAGGDDEHEAQLRILQHAALDAVSKITRSLMDASGHAHLLKRDERTRNLSLNAEHGGWVEEDTLLNRGDARTPRNKAPRNGWASPHVSHESRQRAAREPTPEPTPPKAATTTRLSSMRLSRSASSLVSVMASMMSGSGSGLSLTDGLRQKGSSFDPDHGAATPVEEVKTPAADLRLRIERSEATDSTDTSLGKDRSSASLSPRRDLTDAKGMLRGSSILRRQNERQRNRDQLSKALHIYHNKSLKKAIKYLIAVNFMSDTPREVASFLRMYAHELSEEDIGDYLGEGGATESDEKYYNLIRLSYVRAISFVDMPFEVAMRHFLTNCGFKLPGEAQKVDRILSTFCVRYWEDNKGTPVCPFSNSDTMFVVAFAVIMLNTDLHRANTDSKNRHRRMTKQDFVRNLRGVDSSTDLNNEFLTGIYDSIAAQPIAIGVGAGSDGLGVDGASDRLFAASVARRQSRFQRLLKDRLKRDEEMLAGLELNGTQNRFFRVGVETNLSLDLLRLMFESTWFHFHGLVTHILEGEGRQDTDAVSAGLDILRYCLSAAIFLKMSTVLTAFATQLARFRYRFGSGLKTMKPRKAAGMYFIEGQHLNEPWFHEIVNSQSEQAWDSIAKVHGLFIELKAEVEENDHRRELEALARRLDVRADILNGPRSFIREGDLVKLCRSGKKVQYRFFLFSDQLIYTHQALVGGQFKLHERLPVCVMRIEDLGQSHAFHIHHPKKSFTVFAPTEEDKRIWIRVLNDAIEVSLEKRDMEKQLVVEPRLAAAAEAAVASVEEEKGAGGMDSTGMLKFDESPRASSPTNLSMDARASLARTSLASMEGSSYEGLSADSGVESWRSSFTLQNEAAGAELTWRYREALGASSLLLDELRRYGEDASNRSSLSFEKKLEVYGLMKQAQNGDCGPFGEAADNDLVERKREAWTRYRGMSQEDAKVAFIEKLNEVMPEWRAKSTEEFLPGAAISPVDPALM